MQRLSRSIVLSVLVLMVCVSASAQNAGFSGEVTDPQKAAVANADVRVVKQATGVERLTRTNNSGFYAVPSLAPGTYRIFAQAPGFQTELSEEITITVGQMLVVNFQLRLGAMTDVVTVSAGSQVINTTDGTVSTVVDRQFVENIPLNGRSFETLITLAPGVQTNVADFGKFAVNGQRGNANYFMVDGVSANVSAWFGTGLDYQAGSGTLPATNIQGGFSGLVSVDDLQEFQVLTSTFSPEFGRSPGAEVILVTRSGTNEYHGALYEYLRNEVFDANDWFANALGFPRAPRRLNDYGGTWGGPVRFPGYSGRDKTFFFFSYENQGFKLPFVAQTIVPTLSARQSATPDAAPILNAFPKPNGADVGLDGAMFNAAYATPTHSYGTSFRVDHRFSDKFSVFGRFDFSPSSNSEEGIFNFAGRETNESNIQTYTMGATQVFNSRWVNDIRTNYTRTVGSSTWTMTTLGGAVPPSNAVLWPAGKVPAYGRSIFDILNVGGSYDLGFISGRANANVPHQYQVVDNLSYLRGKHQFKFGVDARLLRSDVSPVDLESDIYFANPTDTTSGIATMNSGTATELFFYNIAGQTIDFKAFSAYAQDSWRVSPRLALTFGTRWEVNPPPSTVKGPKAYTACCPTDLSNLSLSAGGAPQYRIRYHNFAPRLGVAYQIVQTPGRQLVVRGGGGIFYDLGQTGDFGDNSWPYSNFIDASEVPFPVPGSFYTFPPADPVPSPSNPAQVTMADTNFRLPRTYEWNLTLEQSFGSGQTVSAAYVGARGRDLLRIESFIDPNPNFSFVDVVSNNGFSSYDSLQVQYTRRLTHGLQAYASYTYSHSIDNASSDIASVIPTLFVKTHIDKGDSEFDVRHTFSGAFVYLVPVPKRGKAANTLLHDWSMQGIFTSRTALPFDILAADPQSITDPRFFATARANLVPGQPLFLYGSSFPGGKAANPAAFTGLNPGQVQGDLGRNRLRGFGLVQFDFSLMRRFKIKDKASLEFRIEAFNIFNHPNFFNPDFFTNFVGAPMFGQSEDMFGAGLSGGYPGVVSRLFAIGGPRDLQLALRFEF